MPYSFIKPETDRTKAYVFCFIGIKLCFEIERGISISIFSGQITHHTGMQHGES